MINFGKHKNETYDNVFKNDIKYCNWVLTQTTTHEGINNFKQYLKNNKRHLIPKYQINCSSLSLYYCNDVDFLKLLNGLNIEQNTLNIIEQSYNGENTTLIQDENNVNKILLPCNINGIYIDYLIRYLVCCELNKEFNDDRCDNFINGVQFVINADELPLKIKKNISSYSDDDEDFVKNDYICCYLKDNIEQSYNNMKLFNATNNDIFNVSLCHSFFFGEMTACKYFDYFIDVQPDNYEYLQQYIKQKINGNNENILCNPTLGNRELKISADADLIINKELIDIKCSKKKIGDDINDFLQLLIYVCLYFYNTNIKCEKITIFNPIQHYEKYIDLTNWDNFEKVVEILKNRIQ